MLHRILVFIGLCLLVATIFFVGPARIAESARRAHLPWVAASLVAMMTCQCVRAGKWGLLLYPEDHHNPQGRTRFLGVMGCYFINAFFSNLTPARSGEALVPWLLDQRCAIDKRRSIAMILVDRSLELANLAVVVILAGGWFTIRLGSESTVGRNALFASIFLGAIFLGIVMAIRFSRVRPGRDWQSHDFHGKPWIRRFSVRWGRIRGAVQELAKFRLLAKAGLLTILAWVLDTAGYCLMVNAYLPISIVDSAASHALAGAAGLLSCIPGGLGVSTLSYVAGAGVLGYAVETVAMGSLMHLILNNLVRAGLAGLASSRPMARAELSRAAKLD